MEVLKTKWVGELTKETELMHVENIDELFARCEDEFAKNDEVAILEQWIEKNGKIVLTLRRANESVIVQFKTTQ